MAKPLKSARTGYAKRTLPTHCITERQSTWYKPAWATPRWPPPAPTSTPPRRLQRPLPFRRKVSAEIWRDGLAFRAHRSDGCDVRGTHRERRSHRHETLHHRRREQHHSPRYSQGGQGDRRWHVASEVRQQDGWRRPNHVQLPFDVLNGPVEVHLTPPSRVEQHIRGATGSLGASGCRCG